MARKIMKQTHVYKEANFVVDSLASYSHTLSISLTYLLISFLLVSLCYGGTAQESHDLVVYWYNGFIPPFYIKI